MKKGIVQFITVSGMIIVFGIILLLFVSWFFLSNLKYNLWVETNINYQFNLVSDAFLEFFEIIPNYRMIAEYFVIGLHDLKSFEKYWGRDCLSFQGKVVGELHKLTASSCFKVSIPSCNPKEGLMGEYNCKESLPYIQKETFTIVLPYNPESLIKKVGIEVQ
ncbi:MAG: hypothetical protein B6U78_00350 [Candidatus Aenigmarchaeota archaeon ex4484_224]|nr:MAG: hypothetical protein B6U78_00350 [Candidatus Aenigmarchaeota archaeon ex4484_224]